MTDPQAKYGEWATGICGCLQDMRSCCCGWCCPCVLVGRIVEIIDQGATSNKAGCCTFCLLASCTGFACFYTFGYRAKLRAKYGLPAEPCADLCTDCFCLTCSICQVYRELQKRLGSLDKGYSPSIKERYEAPTQTVYDKPAVYDEPPQEQSMSQDEHHN
ncbi:hypothetical protein MPTK1_3g13930 [Marchantia polymorpha subsp. ruderalis]|uniref:Uncharacterized protein n=2 Tax=Marchantia polymorpha TaxID=3197 RepID=A0A176W3Z0_MARPO|nr:hypothetical protein AXG93_4666s1360 [Marchantia polymorpha subsp. ruderalis]PTQ49051.1 hypothetical protein MARPO_0004s0278 [Marchantia polymorpha]BBN05533.1 hypothetical protein Mp_3g13930 [Marchantia polymorpha subsp. ruderalis]|eukprot:PTQ49051.1 hypothetical protein MARPO_0004s0278 [Marchantia polymorpha]